MVWCGRSDARHTVNRRLLGLEDGHGGNLGRLYAVERLSELKGIVMKPVDRLEGRKEAVGLWRPNSESSIGQSDLGPRPYGKCGESSSTDATQLGSANMTNMPLFNSTT